MLRKKEEKSKIGEERRKKKIVMNELSDFRIRDH